MTDVAHRGLGQSPGPDDARQVALDQSDARAFHRHIGAGAHGDAHIGLGQRGRVVHPVAGHGDREPLAFQGLHQRVLVFGADPGMDLVNAEFRRDRPCRGLGVAGCHDDAQAQVVQRADRVGRGRLDPVRHRDEARRLSVDRDEHRRLALGLKRRRALGEPCGIDLQILHQRRIAERDAPPSDASRDALAGHGLEIRTVLARGAAILGARDQRLGQGMFRSAFERGDQRQQLGRVHAAGFDIRECRLALGQCAGLVEDQRIHPGEPLQRLGIADQDAGIRPAPRGHHDRHRRGQAKRAGTGDDHHGNSGDEGVGQGRSRSERPPGREGQQGDPDDGGHEIARHLVRHRLDRRPRSLGAGHHLHDAAERRVLAHALGLHQERSGLVQRAAGDRLALDLLDRDGFAGDHAFIDRGPSLGHHAVHRHALARTHPQDVACPEHVQRDVLLGLAGDAPRGLGGEAHQRADRVAGAFARGQLHHLPQQDEHEDHRRRLEIDRRHPHVAPHLRGQQPRRQHRDDRKEIGRPGAETDQGPHVGTAVPHRRPRAPKEHAGEPDHGGRQQELQPDKGRVPHPVDEGNADMAAHLEKEHRPRQRRGDAEPPLEIDVFRVRSTVGRGSHRLERHAADRTVAGVVLHDLGVHRTGIERALGHRLGRGAVPKIVLGIALELRLTAGRAEVDPLAGVLGHVFGRRPFDGHAADRILGGPVGLGVGLEPAATALGAEVVCVATIRDDGFPGSGIDRHAADRIPGDPACLLLVLARLAHDGFPSFVGSTERSCRASSSWRVKGCFASRPNSAPGHLFSCCR
ncbi:hypothetical protein OB2597_09104 [Pseudooceanicola batsensis HTCC2597]|uniref:Uncharacterized protein n=1 Tax=Pseudooceanicola batsensis (strain ATCC BAA-863 / DSM 15984 / KCTC 12145 / HTCC2597) TaxID=252305 RepID=A3TUU3_PSEBH|nr:hypothetical protein OB2597_09104 [Pseudooceanicola batsensis HTCC2597]